jgi:hypothetical protein
MSSATLETSASPMDPAREAIMRIAERSLSSVHLSEDGHANILFRLANLPPDVPPWSTRDTGAVSVDPTDGGCDRCVKEQCRAEASACAMHPACAQASACFNQCADTTCGQACIEQSPDLEALRTCALNACGQICGG